jgi:hypothetical protein
MTKNLRKVKILISHLIRNQTRYLKSLKTKTKIQMRMKMRMITKRTITMTKTIKKNQFKTMNLKTIWTMKTLKMLKNNKTVMLIKLTTNKKMPKFKNKKVMKIPNKSFTALMKKLLN